MFTRPGRFWAPQKFLQVLDPDDQEAERLLHRALTHHSTVGPTGPQTPEQLQLTRLVTTASTVTSLLLSQDTGKNGWKISGFSR